MRCELWLLAFKNVLRCSVAMSMYADMDCIWAGRQKKRRSQSAMPARPPLPTVTPLERRSCAVARGFALLHGASELHPALCGSTLCAERGACSSRQPCACCAQHAPTGDSIPGRGRCVAGGQAGGPMLSPARRSVLPNSTDSTHNI
jgi:hypothetical protein